MTGSFRFLHAADIHLDSPMKGLSTQTDEMAERIRSATGQALDRLVTHAIGESVNFVIIAGDLYDGDWRDFGTGLFFTRQMARLRSREIPLFLLHGNHDAASQITKQLELPDNVRVFGSRKAQTFELKELGVALHGRSFARRDISDNLVPGYPGPTPDCFNIGVLHTGLGGASGHENYAPCTLNDLVNKGYDYWALGHIHQASVRHEFPHVVFPGNLQGRHIRETGPKGAQMVTVTDGEITESNTVVCDVVRWSVLRVDVGGAADLGDVRDLVRNALGDAVAEEADGRLLVCRVELAGRSEIHDQIIASHEQILADARGATHDLGVDVACIEKVDIGTVPARQPGAEAIADSVLWDMQQWFQDARNDAALRDEIKKDIAGLVSQLPHDVRAEADEPMLNLALQENYDALISESIPFLDAQLSADEA